MSGHTTYVARELVDVPEVTSTLLELGLGELETSSVRGHVGRNDNWSGTTTSGHRVFVKRLRGVEGEVELRRDRLIRFETFRAGRRATVVSAPPCLGWNAEDCVFVYGELAGVRTGAELMVDQQFTPALAAAVGRSLAELHRGRLDDDPRLDSTATLLPSARLLDGLPLELFRNSSAAQLHAWALMQQDAELVAAVQELGRAEQDAPRVPAHCDLRVDQLLVASDDLYLCDWEEFRAADAARDTGSFVGEWLYRAMLDIPTVRGASGETRLELDAARVLERGASRLAALRPLIVAFWQAYTAGVDRHDLDLAARTTAFAGWHLLDRLLAGAMTAPRLQPVQRAAAGVGRRALIDSQRFHAAIGLSAPVPAGVSA